MTLAYCADPRCSAVLINNRGVWECTRCGRKKK